MLDRMLRAFRHKNYNLYFFGQGVSLVGNWLTTVAMSWTVYRLTRESQPERAALLLGDERDEWKSSCFYLAFRPQGY